MRSPHSTAFPPEPDDESDRANDYWDWYNAMEERRKDYDA